MNCLQRRIWYLAVAVGLTAAVGCVPDMADQPRYEPLERSDFFEDRMASRSPVPGTLPRGQLQLDSHFYRGKVDGQLAESLPMELTPQLLAVGQERFNINCSHCHGRVGYGQGMVVKRGFPAPPSFHIERLRSAKLGHFFDVITNGIGRMPQHGTKVAPDDRWAITAYIRALQLSQYASAAQLTEEEVEQLTEAQQSDAQPSENQETVNSEPGNGP